MAGLQRIFNKIYSELELIARSCVFLRQNFTPFFYRVYTSRKVSPSLPPFLPIFSPSFCELQRVFTVLIFSLVRICIIRTFFFSPPTNKTFFFIRQINCASPHLQIIFLLLWILPNNKNKSEKAFISATKTNP